MAEHDRQDLGSEALELDILAGADLLFQELRRLKKWAGGMPPAPLGWWSK
jgi:hypothetical protein